MIVTDYKNKKNTVFFCTNNYSKITTYTVLNTLSVDCNFKISGLRCIKLQHTNDPDKLGPGKHRFISSCFMIWWKDLLCSIIKWLPFKKKERQNTKTNLLCKLLWMGLWNNENSARSFKYYNYLEELQNNIRALVLNDVKGEILEDWYKASLKEVCEAFQNKLL